MKCDCTCRVVNACVMNQPASNLCGAPAHQPTHHQPNQHVQEYTARHSSAHCHFWSNKLRLNWIIIWYKIKYVFQNWMNKSITRNIVFYSFRIGGKGEPTSIKGGGRKGKTERTHIVKLFCSNIYIYFVVCLFVRRFVLHCWGWSRATLILSQYETLPNCIIYVYMFTLRAGLYGDFFSNFELRYLGHLQTMRNRLRITNQQKKLQIFCRQTSYLQNKISVLKRKKLNSSKVEKYETKVVEIWKMKQLWPKNGQIFQIM